MASAHTTATQKDYSFSPFKFAVGERVMRQIDPVNKSKGMWHGSIRAVRRRLQAAELYDVVWDHDTTKIDKGYLAFGLSVELPEAV